MHNESRNILVIVAHPDDETLGMGGTINKHINNGDKVFVISMTNGVSSRENINSYDIQEREIAANMASKNLGFIWHKRYEFPDNEMDKYPLLDYTKCIEESKNQL